MVGSRARLPWLMNDRRVGRQFFQEAALEKGKKK